jgi:hypothetical protein
LRNLVSWDVKKFHCLTSVCRDHSSSLQIRHSPPTPPNRSKSDNGALNPRFEVTSQSGQYHLEKRKIYTSPANQCSKSDLPLIYVALLCGRRWGVFIKRGPSLSEPNKSRFRSPMRHISCGVLRQITAYPTVSYTESCLSPL